MLDTIAYDKVAHLSNQHRQLLTLRYKLNEDEQVVMSANHPAVLEERSIGRGKQVYQEGHLVKADKVRWQVGAYLYSLPTSEVALLLYPE